MGVYMEIKIKILRKKKGKEESFWQTFYYSTENEKTTIVQMLTELNQRKILLDIEGRKADKIQWECNCQQRKCGACAMLINGMPNLACGEKIGNYKDTIELQPLQKFPVIADLIVDRSVIFENLKKMHIWMESEQDIDSKNWQEVFVASQCLQCGCCLEICTNYTDGKQFFGMTSLVLARRVSSCSKKLKENKMMEKYKKHFFDGCDKFNACEHVCPAGLPLTKLMAHMNSELEIYGGEKRC